MHGKGYGKLYVLKKEGRIFMAGPSACCMEADLIARAVEGCRYFEKYFETV